MMLGIREIEAMIMTIPVISKIFVFEQRRFVGGFKWLLIPGDKAIISMIYKYIKGKNVSGLYSMKRIWLFTERMEKKASKCS